MHCEPRRLVDEHDAIVLEYDALAEPAEAGTGGHRGTALSLPDRRDSDPIAGLDPITRADTPGIHAHLAGAHEPVYVTARHAFEIAEQKVVESLTRELVVDLVIAGRGAFGSFFGHNRGPYNCGIRQLCYITWTEAACVAFGAIRQCSGPTLE